MKKRIVSLMCAVLVFLPMLLSANALESKDDFSDLFFVLMKDYTDVNELHEGLSPETYNLLGTTTNGFHIAYCEYYLEDVFVTCYSPKGGDNTYIAGSNFIETSDYVIVGGPHKDTPSRFAVYCFNENKCFTLEDAVKEKDIPFGEVADIVNKHGCAYIYDKSTDITEALDKSDIFASGLLDARFCQYTHSNESYCSIYGKYDKYYLFYGSNGTASCEFTSEIIEDFVVIAPEIESPYDLGKYVFDGDNIYTLKEASEKSLFKMNDVKDLIPNIYLWGDVNEDNTVDMEDVVYMQKVMARLIIYPTDYFYYVANADSNYCFDMYDIVLVQRKIAKLCK
ncbi:MAG: hypothetical protein K6F76_00550 [Clostridiales bacterium]|nr:hypothetical protein [Clostridiales bacterium]